MKDLIEKLHEHGFRARDAYDFDRTYSGPSQRGTETSIVIHVRDLNITISHVITARMEWWKAEARERIAPRRRWGAEGSTWAEALANTHDFEEIEEIECLLT